VKVIAYTDGSSRGNPGPSGWAALIGDELYSDYLEHATNNEAEVWACLMAVSYAPPGCELHIVTDSKWAIRWLSGEKGTRKKHIAGLIKAYHDVRIAKGIKVVTFEHVHGHRGHPQNERVDRAAHAQATKAMRMLEARPRPTVEVEEQLSLF
jgi:ribonuclease HI